MSKDPRMNALMDFFSSELGATFVDADTRENLIDDDLTLCKNCYCMTRTYKKDNTCLKCGAEKGEQDEKVSGGLQLEEHGVL